jgi:hypothetical protein
LAPRRKPKAEEWDTAQVAAYLGYVGPHAEAATRGQLSRWGIAATARQPGRAGKNLYPADQIRAKHEARTGQGRRTDRLPREDQQ